MGWFPFLFYSTTYIADVARRHGARHGARDEGKTGSFGMLLFALVAIAAGTLLPLLTHAGPTSRADTPAGDERGAHAWRRVSLRSMWTLGTLTQAALLFGTFGVHTQRGALTLVALMGVPWSIWTWVPFALLGEFVREAESHPAQDAAEDQWSAHQIMDRPERGVRTSAHDADSLRRHSSARSSMFDTFAPSDSPRVPSASLVSSVVSRGREVQGDAAPLDDSIRGGTILGIHNLAVVVPQFIVALVAALIFRVTSTPPRKHHPGSDGDVAWVLRFGALMALGAAVLTRTIPLTASETRASHAGYAPLALDEDEEADLDTPPDS